MLCLAKDKKGFMQGKDIVGFQDVRSFASNKNVELIANPSGELLESGPRKVVAGRSGCIHRDHDDVWTGE